MTNNANVHGAIIDGANAAVDADQVDVAGFNVGLGAGVPVTGWDTMGGDGVAMGGANTAPIETVARTGLAGWAYHQGAIVSMGGGTPLLEGGDGFDRLRAVGMMTTGRNALTDGAGPADTGLASQIVAAATATTASHDLSASFALYRIAAFCFVPARPRFVADEAR
jgi:hypothetical protein